MVVDEGKIAKAVMLGVPLTITTYTLPKEMETSMEAALAVFLRLAGQDAITEYITYCMRELAGNAKKANTKRCYFSELGLDIGNPDDYRKGMAQFKENTLGNIDYYLAKQQEMGLYIKLALQLRDSHISIGIRNNAVITRAELIRVHERMVSSRQYENLEDALLHILDNSEGAGLGLVILILMLKKIGLGEECFEIWDEGGETVAQIQIPLDHAYAGQVSELSQAIAASVSALPQFPENILAIQRLLSSAEAQMGDIAKHLTMDPAIAADLLRIVNSAQYMLGKKMDSIFEAVKMVGIRGIKNLLYSYGTQKVLGGEPSETSNSGEKRQLWHHSYKTAFYAYNLVKNFKPDHEMLDDIYAGGILHDMGKIIFSNARPKLLNQIRNICAAKNISRAALENLTAGINHAEIGALIAEKWNFPDCLIAAIRFHHNPAAAPAQFRDLVDSVYLANMLCEYENGAVSFNHFAGGPLANFGIAKQSQLDALLKRFSHGFRLEY